MKILIVDDDTDVVEAISLSFGLQWPDARIVEAKDGRSALTALTREAPDVVLLDIALPDMDGFDVLRRVRERSDVPVLMISARGEEIDKVRGLELGADDYVTKPFGYLELSARIKAVMRRAQALPPVSGDGQFEAGPIAINYGRRGRQACQAHAHRVQAALPAYAQRRASVDARPVVDEDMGP